MADGKSSILVSFAVRVNVVLNFASMLGLRMHFHTVRPEMSTDYMRPLSGEVRL